MGDAYTAPQTTLAELPNVEWYGQTATGQRSLKLTRASLVLNLISAAASGYEPFATTLLRDADTTSPVGTLAYVYANNGSALDPANGFYQKTASSWENAAWLGAVFQAAIQPVLDEIEDRLVSGEDYRALLDANMIEYVDGKNLLNPAGILTGTYLNTGAPQGNVLTTSNTAFQSFVAEFEVGDQFTLSAAAAMPVGIAFYANLAATTPVGGTYIGTVGSVPRTFTVPAGGPVVRFNIGTSSTPTPANIQLERGPNATAFEAWHPPLPRIRLDAIEEAPAPDYVVAVTSPNLLDPDAIRDGFYVDSATGNILSSTGLGCSGFIDCTAGMEITRQGTLGQGGLAFFSSASDTAFVPGSYVAGAEQKTVRVPRGATKYVTNLYSLSNPSFANVQVEHGPNATPYKPFGAQTQIKSELVTKPGGKKGLLTLARSSANGSSSIEIPFGDGTFRWNISPLKPRNHSVSDVFNFASTQLNGVFQQTQGHDDVVPYGMYRRNGNRHVMGGNHGYYGSRRTGTAHGKDNRDVGAIYTTGGVEWVIVDNRDTTTLTLLNRGPDYVTLPDNATLTHVSGGVNTASFNSGTVPPTPGEHFPVYKNRRFAINVDGREVEDWGAQYAYDEHVTFTESYDVIGREQFVEWLIAQPSTVADRVEYGGDADFNVSHSYRFDRFGTCTITTDVLVLRTIPQFTNLMLAQSQPMDLTGNGPIKYYVPNSLPFTEAAVNYDFRAPFDMTAYITTPAGNGLNFFAGTRCEATGQLCDRVVMLNNKVGFATGFLPVMDADPTTRRNLVTDVAILISQNGKIYIHAVDDVASTGTRALNPGDYFSVVAYKAYFPVSADRTANYAVPGPDGDYLFCDWHGLTKLDRVPLREDLHGRAFETKALKNVTVKSKDAATNNVAFDVSGSGGAGQAFSVLKFPK